MSNIIQGLKAFNKYENDKAEAANRKSVDYLTLKDKESVEGRFLQELDADLPGYSEKNGLVHVVLEHKGPGSQGYKRRALCTIETGNCYPCEQRRKANQEGTEEWKNWSKASPRYYINFVVDPETDNERVVVINQGVEGQATFFTDLIEEASNGGIVNKKWRLTRRGAEASNTTYRARVEGELDKSAKPVEDFEVVDLSTVYRQIPYEEQEQYYENTPGWVSKKGLTDSQKEEDKSTTAKAGFANW